ncbi:MAG: hypothetical protein LBR48_07660 [Dysgonamonadaceae bacterium]|jgi:hypothetical protein|nr:hypothetical protein [Dysgonamonadaceae bacterium]
MYTKTLFGERILYMSPIVGVTHIKVEPVFATSLNVGTTPQIEDLENGDVVDDDIIFGL